jgi:hypothetical protein
MAPHPYSPADPCKNRVGGFFVGVAKRRRRCGDCLPKKFKKKSKKALTLGFARISSSVPTATSVSELGMFFAGLPRVLEQVRGGVVIPKMSLRQATATWVGSPLPQPPETIFDSAGPVSHKQ